MYVSAGLKQERGLLPRNVQQMAWSNCYDPGEHGVDPGWLQWGCGHIPFGGGAHMQWKAHYTCASQLKRMWTQPLAAILDARECSATLVGALNVVWAHQHRVAQSPFFQASVGPAVLCSSYPPPLPPDLGEFSGREWKKWVEQLQAAQSWEKAGDTCCWLLLHSFPLMGMNLVERGGEKQRAARTLGRAYTSQWWAHAAPSTCRIPSRNCAKLLVSCGIWLCMKGTGEAGVQLQGCNT